MLFKLSLQPFGHNLTQTDILREGTILLAKSVDFPSRPAVSTEAKVIGLLQITVNR